MTSGIASKGVDLDSIFDPYVAGTTKARAAGIAVAGSDTSNRYANIIYGSAAAATGIQSEDADLNTLYAAKGTAQYSLPINGNTYNNTVSVPAGKTLASVIGFKTGGSAGSYTYTVWGNTAAGGTVTLASGSLPSSSASIKYAFGTYTVPIGLDGGGSTNNGAASATALTSLPQASYTTQTEGSSAGTYSREYPFTITIYDASSNVISTTNINLVGQIEGSA